jgi:hypothetical protein
MILWWSGLKRRRKALRAALISTPATTPAVEILTRSGATILTRAGATVVARS